MAVEPAPLRILHLEDDRADRDLVRHVLASSPLVCDLTWAAGREEVTRRWMGKNSTWFYPTTHYPVTTVKLRWPLPEFVSGTLGEEQATESLKSDFNNVLTVVMGCARRLLDRPSMPPDAIEGLTQIFTAGNRAANLTRQLLVFSRKQPIERRGIDLGLVAADIANMLRYVIGEHIKLDLISSVKACAVEADAGMPEQVLMNLAVNAGDAMATGGTLTIGVEPLVVHDASARPSPEARTGEFVCLSVHDTGCGIPAENLQRSFEPFFTTKEVGRGTGLGLSMVFGIVQQHQCWIEIESTVGKGTCFRILVPAAPSPAVAPKRLSGRNPAFAGGSETILLVEDESSVREFIASVLRGHGYRVLQASTGADALEVWRWHATRITLSVSDVVLPDSMGWLDLIELLRGEEPALKVVLMSGCAREVDGTEFQVPSGVHYIQKPGKPQTIGSSGEKRVGRQIRSVINCHVATD